MGRQRKARVREKRQGLHPKAPSRTQKRSLAIGYVHPMDAVSPFFTNSLVRALVADCDGDHLIGAIVSRTSGPMVDLARNEVIELFLADDSLSWLLMMDADMVWSYEHVLKLLAAADSQERPVVAGLFFEGRSGNLWPSMLTVRDDGSLEIMYKYPKDTLVPVDIVGAGFLLIHREVLANMGRVYGDQQTPWFAFGHTVGDDFAFCLRVRALGYPIYVDTGVKVDHMNPAPLGVEEYEQMREGAAHDVKERLVPSGEPAESRREQAPFAIPADDLAYIRAAEGIREKLGAAEQPQAGSDPRLHPSPGGLSSP